MSNQDGIRWDDKWRAMAGLSLEPHPLLTKHAEWLQGGMALDLACGRGQNAIWLAVDISQVALEAAAAESRRLDLDRKIRFEKVDLENWFPPRESFDLICVFRFLSREHFHPIQRALKAGGWLFYSTRHVGVLASRAEANPAYLLEMGELATAFSTLEVLHYDENEQDAELIALKGVGATPPSIAP